MPPHYQRNQNERRYQGDRIRWEPLWEQPEEPRQAPMQKAPRRGNVGRFIALLLLLFAAGLLWWFYFSIVALIAKIGRIGQRPSSDDLLMGFEALGLILVTIVAVVKIVVEGQRRS